MPRREHPGGRAGGIAAGDATVPVDLIDWAEVFANVCHTLGWTWDEAEQQLDLHRLRALWRHWERNPPVHRLVADYLGYRAEPSGKTSSDDDDGLEVLASVATPLQASAHTRDAIDNATDSLAALAVIERMHFGELKDV